MKLHLKILSIILISLFFITSCKEGTGGKSKINGYTKHHSLAIPNCVVYIKYGATDFPGENTANYDASVTADVTGHFEFTGLRKGDYYLYGLGYDTSISEVVKGGIGVKVKYNKTLTVNVPVTE